MVGVLLQDGVKQLGGAGTVTLACGLHPLLQKGSELTLCLADAYSSCSSSLTWEGAATALGAT
jgi:hypothetical protein